MRNSTQNGKLEQWLMQGTAEDVVLGSILGCQVKKVFFFV